MPKKIIIIVSVVMVLAAAFLYLFYRTDIFGNNPQTGDIPGEIGSIITKPLDSDIKVGTEVNNLRKALPLTTASFTITSYDYAKGQFAVELGSDPSNTVASFFIWQKTSAYSSIPRDMFYFK